MRLNQIVKVKFSDIRLVLRQFLNQNRQSCNQFIGATPN